MGLWGCVWLNYRGVCPHECIGVYAKGTPESFLLSTRWKTDRPSHCNPEVGHTRAQLNPAPWALTARLQNGKKMHVCWWQATQTMSWWHHGQSGTARMPCPWKAERVSQLFSAGMKLFALSSLSQGIIFSTLGTHLIQPEGVSGTVSRKWLSRGPGFPVHSTGNLATVQESRSDGFSPRWCDSVPGLHQPGATSSTGPFSSLRKPLEKTTVP